MKKKLSLLIIALMIMTMTGCAETLQKSSQSTYDIDEDLAFISKTENEWVSEEEWRQNH